MKRVFALLLLLCLLAQPLVPAALAADETVRIDSPEALLALAQSCVTDTWSQGRTVVLTADIDLTGAAFRPIPLFGGSFDGQGHTVRGLSLIGDGSTQGLFRRILPGGTVENLSVEGWVSPAGTRSTVGGIAGSNGGTIRNCTFTGTAAGAQSVGGIAGVNEAGGLLSGCAAAGDVTGEHRVGGVAGENYGTILNCTSACSVNTVYVEPTTELSDLENPLTNLTVSQEELIDITDIGGIAGCSAGVLQGCANTGDVGYARVGYNVGGVVGRQSGYTSGCSNSGAVLGRKDAGGIAGQMEPSAQWQFSDASVESLRAELDTLQVRLRQTIDDAGGLSGGLNDGLQQTLDRLDDAGAALDDLSGGLEHWADANIGAINTLSTRISELLTDLTPISDSAAQFLDDLELAVGQYADAMDDLAEAGDDADLAWDHLEDCFAALEAALADARDGAAQIRSGMEHLRAALGDEAGLKAALQEIADGFSTLSGAADRIRDAVSAAEGTGALGEFLAALQEELPQLTDGLAQISGALEQLAAQLDAAELAEALRRFEAGMADLGDALSGLGRASGYLREAIPHLKDAGADLTDAAKRAADATDRLKKSLESLNRAADGVTDLLSKEAGREPIQFTTTDSGLSASRDRLFDALGSASDAVGAMSADLAARSDRLRTDLQALSDQLFTVFDRLLDALDSTGGRAGDYTEDVSADQEQDPGSGVLRGCVNRGDVAADTNAGGVVGAVSLDLSFDPDDTLDLSGMLSGGTKYVIYAAVRGCESYGDVTAKKSAAGGVAGRMDYGLAADSVACGRIACTDGDYVGGVAGYCLGTIRRSYARVGLSGGKYVGGIAGLAGNLSDCCALLEVTAGAEYVGGVAGGSDGVLSGNRYCAEGILGGVDGFTYAGQTAPISYGDLLLLDGVPAAFGEVVVTFMAGGRVVEERRVPFGSAVEDLPAVPDQDGRFWVWDEFGGDRVYASTVVEGSYHAPVATLSTGGERPLFLAEGAFRQGQRLTAEPWEPDLQPLAPEPEQSVSAYVLRVPDYAGQLTVRMRGEGGGALYVLRAGSLQEAPYETDGSYLVFPLENGGSFVYMGAAKRAFPWWIPVLAAALVLTVGALLLLRRRHRRPPAPQPDQPQEAGV